MSEDQTMERCMVIIEKLIPKDVQIEALDSSERIIALLPKHVQSKLIHTLLMQNVLLRDTLDKIKEMHN